MIVNDAIRCVLVLVAAAAILWELPTMAVLAVIIVASAVGASFRAAQGGLVAQIADNPRQLTSTNATAEIFESLAIFFGPALGSLLLMWVSVPAVIAFNALTFLWSMMLVHGVRDVPHEPRASGDEESFLTEASAGFRVLYGDRDMAAFSGLVVVNGFMAGALGVLILVIAADALGDASRMGFLDAASGVGTVVGGVAILSIAHSAKLGRLAAFGALGWCLPVILLGLVPGVVVAFLAIFLIGLCDSMLNVGFATIPQRLVSEDRLSRVFGALVSTHIGTSALGAVVVSPLMALTSAETTMLILGVGGTAVVLLCGLRMPHLDRRLEAPEHLDLVRSLSLFAPLSFGQQEALARQLERLEVAAGTVVVAEDEVSDRFYIIDSGRFRVTQEKRFLRDETAGEFFGEIGLLRDVPRTATVTAEEDGTLLVLSREAFLDAVTGNESAMGAATEVAALRQPI